MQFSIHYSLVIYVRRPTKHSHNLVRFRFNVLKQFRDLLKYLKMHFRKGLGDGTDQRASTRKDQVSLLGTIVTLGR